MIPITIELLKTILNKWIIGGIDMDFNDFCNNFDIVDNALKMRDLLRWNGRAVKNKENLSEHTHLVCACAISLIDELPDRLKSEINLGRTLKLCMYHDALELFRGDILSITKDSIPMLRNIIDNEENTFIQRFVKDYGEIESEIVKLADLMACYKYMEYEIKTPSNDYMLNAYVSTKEKFNVFMNDFIVKYNLKECIYNDTKPNILKAHKSDIGMDIILDQDVTFLPHCTTVIDLNVTIDVEHNVLAYVCSRTSAASKGLIVACSPIDPGYEGNVHAIVHNVSNDVVMYKKGQSFCQLIHVVSKECECDFRLEKDRKDKGIGSTGLC